MKKTITFFITILLTIGLIQAQDKPGEYGKIVTIKTINNEVFTGKLQKISSDSISIFTDEMELKSFAKLEILKFLEGPLLNYFVGTVNSSEPYFTPTALNQGRGNHFYKNYFIFGNVFNFGLSENMTLSTGFETASIIFDSGNSIPILHLGLKFAGSISDHLHIGFSGRVYFNDEGGVIVNSIPLTVGSERSNVTVAPALALSLNGDGEELGLFFNVSVGLGNRIRLVFDGAVFDGDIVYTSMLEISTKSGFTFSPGFGGGDNEYFPNISFSIPFGKWKKKN